MKSLLARFLIYYVPLVGLSIFVLLALLESFFYFEQRAALVSHLKQTADIQQKAISESLWEYDYQLTNELVENTAKLPFILKIEVFDAAGKLVAQAGQADAQASSPDFIDEREIIFANHFLTRVVGRLEISVHQAEIHQRLIEHTRTNALILIVLLVSLVLSTILVSRRVVIKPLTALHTSIKRMDEKNIWEPSSVRDSDEIGEVIKAYNALQAKQIDTECKLREHHLALDIINAELEQRVKERTLELEEAKQLADEANRAKSAFLANMSHEIRTPLNGVIGLLQLLASSTMDEKQSNYVNKAYIASNHLLSLLNEILDYSKIEAGMLNLHVAPFHLHQMLEGVKNTLEDESEKQHLHFDIRIADNCPERLLGDETRLSQVLLNLGGNAIKFTEHGSISISVVLAEERLPNTNADTVSVRFEIRDTGIGIDTNHLQDIFDRFTQAENGTTRRFGGTGLGLAICRSLVQLMGGYINVESTLGEGSIFWFVVPLRRVPQASEPHIDLVHASNIPTLENDVLKGFHILIVDDNLLNQEVVRDMLKGMGAATDTAENGHLAIQRVMNTDRPYDLVLMDMQMPVLDGVSATQKLRRHHPIDDLPIIAMTANAHRSDRETCLAAGMNDFLLKPVAMDALRDIILSHIPAPRMPGEQANMTIDNNFTMLDRSGFEVASALSRINNQVTLYIELAHMLFDNIDETINAIDQSTTEKNIAIHPQSAAERLHKLRSSLLVLGAVGIAKQLADWENELKTQGKLQSISSKQLLENIHKNLSILREIIAELETFTKENNCSTIHNVKV